ncbi:MAG TPA: sigma-70 family RNA polymerase sigma factor [Solirubrobacteraceae bacterium]|nr:sigma-70 family RNA polymerase sigma factor [Solirubrobacteraceae bacterium]
MPPLLQRSRPDDAALARRVAAGDGAAFAALDERHRKPLVRYARSLLRRSEHDAEDVVQDVLIRAHAVLREGRAPDELRPWLYRLTRNRAIDEVRRARWGEESLGDEAAGLHDEREEPEAVLRRRESIRRLVDDLADLPVRQRTALLARELDDQTPEQVAEQLGVSVPAAQMLATRARENLLKTRAARDADHADIRAALLDAHERGVRPTEHVRRHLEGCDACRAYQKDLRKLSKSLHALHPVFGLPLLAGAAKLVGAGGGKAAAGAAAALVIAATGGVVVLASDNRSSGEPAPFVLKGIKPLTGRAVNTGDAIPRGTALVTARVRVPAGAPQDGERRSVTLACPAAMKVAGLQAPEQRFPLGYGLSKDTIIRNSTRARIDFGRAILPRDYDVTVGVLCRRADAAGSIADSPRRTQAGEQTGRVCDTSAYLYREPGRTFLGTVFKGQPLSILRRSGSGQWALVISDTRNKGWMKVSALCG